jgi:hypothetical protein
MNKERYFLLSWDNTGFECVQDITALHPDNWSKTNLIEILKGQLASKNPLAQQIHAMELRARFNPQRHYEIYIQSTDSNVDAELIRGWADRDPQGLADFVRDNHYAKIFSDRNTTKAVIH